MDNRTELTTITAKGQASIPAKIRASLGLKPGDKLLWERRPDGTVTVEKASQLDLQWNRFAYASLSEWDDPADDEAYNGL